MKKSYQSEKYKNYSKNRSSAELKKRRLKSGVSFYKKTKKIISHFVKILAPNICCLEDNTAETLSFFQKIDHVVLQRQCWADLDFSKISKIGNEVLLYLLSRMDYYRSQYNIAPIRGNFPKNPAPKEAFNNSGFYKFVYPNVPVADIPSINTVKIVNGFKVNPIVAHEIKEFVQMHIPGASLGVLKQIYRNVIECMANTNNHAYPSEGSEFKWWIICQVDLNKQQVRFNFLDNGQGIPKTVKRKFLETLTITRDWEFVQAALEGLELRSRTGKKERGKGLPSLYSQYKKQVFQTLRVISRRAFLDFDKENFLDLDNRFHGTLFSWRIQ